MCCVRAGEQVAQWSLETMGAERTDPSNLLAVDSDHGELESGPEDIATQ